MNLTTPHLISLYDSSSSQHQDFLLNEIQLTHVPDSRHLDSHLLLHAIINLISSHVSDLRVDDVNITYTPAVGSEETMGHTLYKISRVLRLKCLEDGDIHTKTMFLLDVLGGYTWDAKIVLILAAFATNYAEFQLLIELSTNNPLAESLAVLKKLPNNCTKLGALFKCLSSVIDAIIEVTKCIIEFEHLPFQHLLLDYKEISVTKSQISIATYWIFRTLLACCSIFTNMPKTICKEQTSPEIAIWELLSMVARLNNIWSDLKKNVKICRQHTETKMYMKLLNLFHETYADNQQVLHTLFCSKDELPLQNYHSQANIGISELKDKVLVLLISNVQVLIVEPLLFLVEQTYNHPYHKNEGNYEILWVPIPASDTWTLDERRSLAFLSNSLPWFSIRQPWLLSSSVVKFVKEEWKFKEDPVMVVIDLQGQVINSTAIDMVFIWGSRASPFSTSREKSLWEDNTQIIQLLVDGIDPLLMHRIEERKCICIYGSDDIDWIREFNTRIQELKAAGLQLEVVYAGTKNATKDIIGIIEEEKLSVSLSLTKIHLFWIRWDSMMKSIFRISKTLGFDSNLAPILELLEIDENSKGWVLIGNGSSTETVKLEGEKALEVLDDFLRFGGEKVGELGVVGAIRRGRYQAAHCDHSKVFAYDDEGNNEGNVVCDECKRVMKKFVVYKCEVGE